jgi:hypothetical protein
VIGQRQGVNKRRVMTGFEASLIGYRQGVDIFDVDCHIKLTIVACSKMHTKPYTADVRTKQDAFFSPS